MRLNYKPVKKPDRSVVCLINGVKRCYETLEVNYNKDKKRSSPKRIYIGTIDENDQLIPNKNYFEIHNTHPEIDISEVKPVSIAVGTKFVFDRIIADLKIGQLLEKTFGSLTSKILDIASYYIDCEDNTSYLFSDYGLDHLLHNKAIFSDSTITNLFKRLGYKEIDEFLKSWVKLRSTKNCYISYDSTNINTKGCYLDNAEFGHAKDDNEVPQINLSIGINQDDGIPLFYDMYPGSIIDMIECQNMVQKAKYYGLNNIGFIVDRGYCSMQNVRFFEKNGYKLVIKPKTNFGFVKDAVDDYCDTIASKMNNKLDWGVYATTIEDCFFGTEKTYFLHLYFSYAKKADETELLDKALNKAEEYLNKNVGKKLSELYITTFIKDHFKILENKANVLLAFTRNEAKIDYEMARLGFYSLITSERMSAKEANEIYYQRDSIEKLFLAMKSHLGFNAFRTQTNETLEGKTFVLFISSILRKEFQNRTKELYNKDRKNNTVPKLLKELNRIKLILDSDYNYIMRYALTKRQKQLINYFKLTQNDFNKFIVNAKKDLNKMKFQCDHE